MSIWWSARASCIGLPSCWQLARVGAATAVGGQSGSHGGSLEQIKRSHETFDPLRDPTMRPTPFQAYLRIQIGCDKFCTYCVVPMTRGPEQGRPPEQILAEARSWPIRAAWKSRCWDRPSTAIAIATADKTTRLADLLDQLHDIEGIERLKFVTNFPKDMTDDRCWRRCAILPKCSPYLHVPLQSGSNRDPASG